MTEPSPAYWEALEQCKQHHAKSKTYSGKLVRPHVRYIRHLIGVHQCETVLDYGCGKGRQYETILDERSGLTIERWIGIPITKYDPAWPPFAKEPDRPHDMVVVAHTLGAVPRRDMSWLIDRVCSLTTKCLYVAEQIGASKKHIFDDPDAEKVLRRADWHAALARNVPFDLVVATKDRSEGGMIEHHRLLPDQTWQRMAWPPHVLKLDFSAWS